MKVVIIGGVAGGATAAARLRRLDEHAQIILLEKGEFISYANCGLPYYIGGAIKRKSELILQTPEDFGIRYRVDVRILSEATLIEPARKIVRVEDKKSGTVYEESYDKLILSTGAKPIRPPIEGVDSDLVFTLRDVGDAYRIKDYADRCIRRNPRALAVVVGAGYIGVEMAENLKHIGMNVTMIDRLDHVIGAIDFDLAAGVHRYLAKNNIQLVLNNSVNKILERDGALSVFLQTGSEPIHADLLILAAGVTPDTLLANKAGIALNPRGSILTDTHMRTNFPDIYAVGDAVEVTDYVSKTAAFIPLAGPANKQGRIAADHICGIMSEYLGTQGSSIIKIFDMAIACTGLNEENARKCGMDYDKIFLYPASHATYYPGATDLQIKVLFERTSGKILGAQIVGFDGVDKRCDVFAAAIRFGATAADLTELELCYAPPFGSAKDPVNMAGYMIENILTGKIKQFHWHDVASIPRDKSATLLDVRESYETAGGTIDGFVPIPLDSLRESIGHLDKSKPVYLCCHSGLRSYVACRILSSYGFDCSHLSGGYRLYRSVMSQKNP